MDTTTTTAQPIVIRKMADGSELVAYKGGTFVRFYDRSLREWTAFRVDAMLDQTAPAAYYPNRDRAVSAASAQDLY